jgi:hypothetical protein
MPGQIREPDRYFMKNPISVSSKPASAIGLVELRVHKIGIMSVDIPGEKYSYI